MAESKFEFSPEKIKEAADRLLGKMTPAKSADEVKGDETYDKLGKGKDTLGDAASVKAGKAPKKVTLPSEAPKPDTKEVTHDIKADDIHMLAKKMANAKGLKGMQKA